MLVWNHIVVWGVQQGAASTSRDYCAAEMKLEALAKESENGAAISDHGRAMSLPGSKERVLKFELQMYKMRDGEYCIDIQVCRPLPLACS